MSDEWDECEYSGLAKAFCAHCTGDKLGDEKADNRLTTEILFDGMDQEEPDSDEIDFEVVRVFQAMYNGVCTIEPAHKIRRGDRVAIVQRADNPMLPVKGVACKACVSILPHV